MLPIYQAERIVVGKTVRCVRASSVAVEMDAINGLDEEALSVL